MDDDDDDDDDRQEEEEEYRLDVKLEPNLENGRQDGKAAKEQQENANTGVKDADEKCTPRQPRPVPLTTRMIDEGNKRITLIITTVAHSRIFVLLLQQDLPNQRPVWSIIYCSLDCQKVREMANSNKLW